MSRKILKDGNPNSTFIQIILNKKKIMGYIDTGATLCFGRKSISKDWIELKKPKEIIIVDKTKHKIWFVLKDILIKIEDKYFYIRSIYEHDSGIDLIIGNNFLKLYSPFVQELDTITLKWFNVNNPEESELVTTNIITKNEILRAIKENLNVLRCMWDKRKFYLTTEQNLGYHLDQVCSENPLDSIVNKI
jgi:hypothetical protein